MTYCTAKLCFGIRSLVMSWCCYAWTFNNMRGHCSATIHKTSYGDGCARPRYGGGGGGGFLWMVVHVISPSPLDRQEHLELCIVWPKVNWCVSNVYLSLGRDLRYREPSAATQGSRLHVLLVSWTLGITCVKVFGDERKTWT